MIISLKCLTHPIVVCLYVLTDIGAASAQSERGSITGTVSDLAANVIPSTLIEAKTSETEPCTAQEVRERQLHGCIQ